MSKKMVFPSCFVLFILLQWVTSDAAIVVSNCIDLNKAIDAVNSGKREEIQISKGIAIDLNPCKGMTQISKSITISGSGISAPTISGNAKHALFSLSGSKIQLTLKNLILTSGQADLGGCVYVPKSSSGKFSNVVFRNCFANIGGAIYNEGFLSLNSVQFVGNKAESGGAILNFGSVLAKSIQFLNNIALSAYGGSIVNYGSLSLNFSRFEFNSAKTNGGAIYSSSAFNVLNSEFVKNSVVDTVSYASGGAIYTSAAAFVLNSTFTANKASGWALGAYGGAIYSQSNPGLTIESSKFKENFVNGTNASGGAVYCNYVNVSSSSFLKNQVKGLSAECGAMDIYQGRILSSSFQSNTAYSVAKTAKGGAVCFNGDMNLTQILKNSVFSSNSITADSSNTGDGFFDFRLKGGAVFSAGNLVEENNTFVGNVAHFSGKPSGSFVDVQGGAIYCDYALITKSSVFSNNLAKSSNSFAGGGAIAARNFLKVTSSSFTFNNAVAECKKPCTFSKTDGGAIFHSSLSFSNGSLRSFFFISNSTFAQNAAISFAGDANGGALSLPASSDPAKSLIFLNFKRNSAKSWSNGYANGGAVFYGGKASSKFPSLSLTYVTFKENSATSNKGARGGSLYVKDNQSLVCSYSTFSSSNSSAITSSGGAIYSGKNTVLSFCRGISILSNNYVIWTGNLPKRSAIYTGFSSKVNFCSTFNITFESSSSFKPIQNCDSCDCSKYFNPCHPLATCKRSFNSLSTTCTCPPKAPGNGLSCG